MGLGFQGNSVSGVAPFWFQALNQNPSLEQNMGIALSINAEIVTTNTFGGYLSLGGVNTSL